MDKLKIVDRKTGEVLMESDFSPEDPTKWKVISERKKKKKRAQKKLPVENTDSNATAE